MKVRAALTRGPGGGIADDVDEGGGFGDGRAVGEGLEGSLLGIGARLGVAESGWQEFVCHGSSVPEAVKLAEGSGG